MFVLLTHLVKCCVSNLLSDGPLPPTFLSALRAYIHGKYKGGGWSLVDLRNVGPYFLNRNRLKYNFYSQFDYFCIHIFDNSQLSRIYIKVTTPRKWLTEFVCWEQIDAAKYYCMSILKKSATFRIGVYKLLINSLWPDHSSRTWRSWAHARTCGSAASRCWQRTCRTCRRCRAGGPCARSRAPPGRTPSGKETVSRDLISWNFVDLAQIFQIYWLSFSLSENFLNSLVPPFFYTQENVTCKCCHSVIFWHVELKNKIIMVGT